MSNNSLNWYLTTVPWFFSMIFPWYSHDVSNSWLGWSPCFSAIPSEKKAMELRSLVAPAPSHPRRSGGGIDSLWTADPWMAPPRSGEGPSGSNGWATKVRDGFRLMVWHGQRSRTSIILYLIYSYITRKIDPLSSLDPKIWVHFCAKSPKEKRFESDAPRGTRSKYDPPKTCWNVLGASVRGFTISAGCFFLWQAVCCAPLYSSRVVLRDVLLAGTQSVRLPIPPSEGGMKPRWHPQSCRIGATLWHAVSFFFCVSICEHAWKTFLFKTKKTESCLVRRNFPQLREPPHTQNASLHLSSPDIPRCKDATPSSDNFHHKSPRKYKSFQISSQILSQTTKKHGWSSFPLVT